MAEGTCIVSGDACHCIHLSQESKANSNVIGPYSKWASAGGWVVFVVSASCSSHQQSWSPEWAGLWLWHSKFNSLRIQDSLELRGDGDSSAASVWTFILHGHFEFEVEVFKTSNFKHIKSSSLFGRWSSPSPRHLHPTKRLRFEFKTNIRWSLNSSGLNLRPFHLNDWKFEQTAARKKHSKDSDSASDWMNQRSLSDRLSSRCRLWILQQQTVIWNVTSHKSLRQRNLLGRRWRWWNLHEHSRTRWKGILKDFTSNWTIEIRIQKEHLVKPQHQRSQSPPLSPQWLENSNKLRQEKTTFDSKRSLSGRLSSLCRLWILQQQTVIWNVTRV